MSRAELITRLEAAGKILRYRPEGNRTARRCLFLTHEAAREYNDDHSAAILLTGRPQIRSAFERWTRGERVFGQMHAGRFTKGRFIRPLHPPPDDIWEIRVTEPVNQARLIGLFIGPDMFLLTQLRTRRVLDEDDGWSKTMAQSEKAWNTLFPGLRPFRGDTIRDYVTENCDDFPIATQAPRRKGAR